MLIPLTATGSAYEQSVTASAISKLILISGAVCPPQYGTALGEPPSDRLTARVRTVHNSQTFQRLVLVDAAGSSHCLPPGCSDRLRQFVRGHHKNNIPCPARATKEVLLTAFHTVIISHLEGVRSMDNVLDVQFKKRRMGDCVYPGKPSPDIQGI
jgi:hypothetical protein